MQKETCWNGSTGNAGKIEADEKHVRMLVNEWNMQDCNASDTPLGGEVIGDDERELMTPGMSTFFRRSAARINYLSQDRPDLNVVSRVIAMKMANPRCGDELLIKRVVRYLKGRPRLRYKYPWGGDSSKLEVYTDSDWAGDREKRRSTSGEVLLFGGHMIGHWSKLQNNPAPSSGEAELNAGAKGLSEMLGVRHLLEQLGVNTGLVHYIDASAAKGVMMRRGAGRTKHLEVRQLWSQHMVDRFRVEVVKIPRRLNLADNLTHAVSKRAIELFREAVGLC